MTVTYLKGDATSPIKRPAIIMHVCNDIGGWGRGFVLALSKKWPQPERAYRMIPRGHHRLGSVGIAPVEVDVVVANMIAQHTINDCVECAQPPIRYGALMTCLGIVEQYARKNPPAEQWSIHAPRLGAGLAGGDWRVIEALIEKAFEGREVYIYDLP